MLTADHRLTMTVTTVRLSQHASPKLLTAHAAHTMSANAGLAHVRALRYLVYQDRSAKRRRSRTHKCKQEAAGVPRAHQVRFPEQHKGTCQYNRASYAA